MEVSGQLHVPAALPPRKGPLDPFYRRLGGPQSQSGRSGEEKNSQALTIVRLLREVNASAVDTVSLNKEHTFCTVSSFTPSLYNLDAARG
jgi:hypothetical protein